MFALLAACSGQSYQGLPPSGSVDSTGASRSSSVRDIFTSQRPALSFTETLLHSFTKTRSLPSGPIVSDSSGAIFGTTEFNNTTKCGCGSVYKLKTDGSATALYTFKGGTDGAIPKSGVIEDSSGNFYGTTQFGGYDESVSSYTPCCGTVFELSPAGSGNYTETLIHEFKPGTGGYGPTNGLAMDSSGNLYGVTTYGGSSDCSQFSESGGCGVLYKLTPGGSGYTYTIVHRFDNTGDDGYWPHGTPLLDSSGDIYGTTSAGGKDTLCTGFQISGCGTVYEFTPSGSGYTEHIVYKFEGSGSDDGASPQTGLIMASNGNIFGTTFSGGDSSCSETINWIAVGCGTVFKLTSSSSGYTESVLHVFDYTAHGFEGRKVPSALIMTGGQLYGSGEYGGANSYGFVFQTAPLSGTTTTVYSFAGPTADGAFPSGPLLANGSTALYGVTAGGGANCSSASYSGCGTVYELSYGSAKRRRHH